MEQHRLKCNIGGAHLSGTSSPMGDMAKNSVTFLNNGGVMDSERQWLHVSNSVSQNVLSSHWFDPFANSFHVLFHSCEYVKVSQLMDTTKRLEARVKFNQKLQWFTVLVFLLLSIAIVYILKLEINNNSSEHCTSRSKVHHYSTMHHS